MVAALEVTRLVIGRQNSWDGALNEEFPWKPPRVGITDWKCVHRLFVQRAQLCEGLPSGLWKENASKDRCKSADHPVEEKECVETQSGQDMRGHLDDQEHSRCPNHLGETGPQGTILRREDLSDHGVGHGTHSEAVGNAGDK